MTGGETIVIGNGISVVGSFQVAEIKRNQLMFQNYGCASMGYDLPGSIGAWIASKKKVVCITGDGSIQMNIQELQTISHLKCQIIVFVINNNGYDSIRQSQTNILAKTNKNLHGVSQIMV